MERCTSQNFPQERIYCPAAGKCGKLITSFLVILSYTAKVTFLLRVAPSNDCRRWWYKVLAISTHHRIPSIGNLFSQAPCWAGRDFVSHLTTQSACLLPFLKCNTPNKIFSLLTPSQHLVPRQPNLYTLNSIIIIPRDKHDKHSQVLLPVCLLWIYVFLHSSFISTHLKISILLWN